MPVKSTTPRSSRTHSDKGRPLTYADGRPIGGANAFPSPAQIQARKASAVRSPAKNARKGPAAHAATDLRAQSHNGVARDYSVVRDASFVARLDAAADRMQAYRSDEQKFNDKRQATGFQPQGPLAFGQYEVGRSSMPRQAKEGTAAFEDTIVRGLIYPHMEGVTRVAMGDPGAYDPYINRDLAARASFTHNKMRRPFNAISARDLKLQIYGEGTPGPGAYQAGRAAKYTHPVVDHNRSVFLSGLPQRESNATIAPSPDAYSPIMSSVYANVRDSGATMRGALARLMPMVHPDHFGGDRSMTEATVGPGSYDEHLHNTVASKLSSSINRSSKLKPGFGTVSPQRALPYGQKIDSPGPGAYQPDIWTGPYSGRSRAQRRAVSAPRERRASPKSVAAEAPASDVAAAAADAAVTPGPAPTDAEEAATVTCLG